MAQFVSRSSAETQSFAKTILEKFSKKGPRPLVLALSGDLGSGKTTFVQGLAKALGVKEKVRSPTFVLVKWHKLRRKNLASRRFVHVDAYRLQKSSEAKRLGLEKVFKDRDAVVAIEWAERIRKLIPKHTTWIQFRHRSPRERIITIRRQFQSSNGKSGRRKPEIPSARLG